MRKFSLVVAAVVALSLAMAPGAQAASADLINGVQQQITNGGGSLSTSPAAQQTFINNLVRVGRLDPGEPGKRGDRGAQRDCHRSPEPGRGDRC
jgi:hypothetical protein